MVNIYKSEITFFFNFIIKKRTRLCKKDDFEKICFGTTYYIIHYNVQLIYKVSYKKKYTYSEHHLIMGSNEKLEPKDALKLIAKYKNNS